ncbi:MAG: hypothetical protein J6B10_10560 [Lachnospiraceae bacterium]|nr:hypothetical protein [Lachnospiraceae bacterium]
MNLSIGSQIPQKNTKKLLFTDSAEVSRVLKKGTVQVNGDTVQISEEARRALEEADRQASQDRETAFMNWIMESNAAVAKQQADAYEKMAEDEARIMEIARRIAAGDKVPASDEKKLMEYSSELYQMAKNAAMLNRNKERREYDSLFEEEETGEKKEATESVEAPARYGVEMEVTIGETPEIGAIAEVELK